MNSIKRVFKFIDMFGESIHLNIKKQWKSKTCFGGILTIVTFSFLIAAAWLMGNDILYKNQPTTDLEDMLLEQRPFYALDKYSFPMAFCFQDYDQLTYNIPSYFRFEVNNVRTFTFNQTTVTTQLEYENCTYNHFPKMDRKALDGAGITNYLCLKNQNVTIGGYWDSIIDGIQYNVFRLRMCDNGTDGGTCAPQAEIDDFISRRPIAFNLYFQNTIINQKKYIDPIEYFIFVLYKNIRLSSSKVLNMYIRKQIIETDEGFFFDEPRKDFSLAYDTSDNDDSDPLKASLMDINLFVANRQPFYHRRYIKIQTIIANIGGLSKTLFVIMYVLSFYISQVKLNKTILNKIIEFDIEKEDMEEVRRPQRINLQLTFSDSPKKNEDLQHKSEAKIVSERTDRCALSNYNKFRTIVETMDKKKSMKKFKLSFCSILKKPVVGFCTGGRTKMKYNLYDKAKDILENYLDISNIVNRFEEYEKFKLVMLSDEQFSMFQFIKKDFCSLREKVDQCEMEKMKQLAKSKENMIRMIMSYVDRLERNPDSISVVDQKLLSLLDNDLKNDLRLG
jgi:hypothetical protein